LTLQKYDNFGRECTAMGLEQGTQEDIVI
jgi:hypothetical protein